MIRSDKLNDKSNDILEIYQKLTKAITTLVIWAAILLFIPVFIWFPFWEAVLFWLGYLGGATALFLLSIVVTTWLVQRKENKN